MDVEAGRTRANVPRDYSSGSTTTLESSGRIPKEEQEVASSGEDRLNQDATASNEKQHNQLDRTKSNASIAERMSSTREVMFVAVVCLSQFMTQAALGQTLSILHVIGDSFGLSNPGDLSWLIAGYSLTVGTFILVAGRFGDMFGYKRMLIIGYVWFSVWSMVAGLSVYSNHVLFVFARVLQGIGPAFCLTNGLALLGASYAPGPRKDMVFALFGACAPGGSMVGATFAGIFAELAWWPWTFWSFSIALAFIAVLASYVVPNPQPKAKLNGQKRSLRQTLIELDPLGGVLGITSLVLVNFAWNQSGVVGWKEPYVYVTLIIGLLLAPVFFYVELRVSQFPLIPFDALSGNVAFVLGCIACGWGSFGIWIYYIWNFAEVLRGATPLLASAWLCPVAVSGAVASIATGFILSKIKSAYVMAIALTAFTVGIILIMTAPVQQSYWAQMFVCTLIIPFGMDMSFPAGTLILSNSVKKEHQGIAASLVNTVVNYSISLSLGFAGTVEGNVNNGGLTPSDELKGYRGAWYMAVGLSGFGIFLSLLFIAKEEGVFRRKSSSKPGS